ncbi:ABC transporter substrate-binding protein [filamentous cyanobacterium LEGE 11480]|uniref:ABC transporter substrate-binding protein n=1 Tax=Romeriopsis navalis LEGE 11480 TaxID=2777977 RepID=A0A928VLB8_9CYAN|nr:ABC transporter substrate-binding protein [Romeriopsis navalis]MBE9028630.1 ABC transporter substrate-binding protein [Romeriopsis navalis LEGE 11480]
MKSPTLFRYGAVALLVGTIAVGCNATDSSQPSNLKSVSVTQIVEHPSLNAVRDGLKEELVLAGFDPDKTLNWQWESAQGNPPTATQIAQKFVGESPNVIVAISTPSAQSAAQASKQTPVIFSAVTDPINAKLVTQLEKPGGLITGVRDFAPADKHLDLIAKLVPKAKRVGVIYNAGESNSVSIVNFVKQSAPARKMTVVEATVSNSAEVATAAKSLVGRADVIYVPTDNTIVSALNSVLQVGIKNKLPVFSGDNESVEKGAIASLGFNYKDIGKQTGKMVVRVLKGEKPGEISVESPSQVELVVNPKAAQQMGVKIPDAMLKEAVKVVK